MSKYSIICLVGFFHCRFFGHYSTETLETDLQKNEDMTVMQ